MATSKLIQGDTITETTHAANGFDPATSDDKISYTSARVANRYTINIKIPRLNRRYSVITPTGHSMTAVCKAICPNRAVVMI